MSQNVTTSLVRFSYLTVNEPREDLNGNRKYSVTGLLPKSDVEGLKILQDAINAEFELEKNGKLKGVTAPKHPIHDGDGVKSNGVPYGDECKGHWVFTATATENRPPVVVDGNRQPITIPTDIYSGCYGHIALSVYAYNVPSNRGIGFGLEGVQKVKDGEPLGGVRLSAEDMFDKKPMQQNSSVAVDPLTGLPMA